jgi:ubiquinone/menaquinone biosynthesis C-methylase UbiE
MSHDFTGVPINDVRNFWNRRPCNIRHSPSPVGSREYFDQVEARKYYVEPHIPPFADFPRWNGKTVLEVGCGIGTDTINFARNGAHVTAVDLSEKSIELAHQRADIFGVSDRIRFYCGNCEDLQNTLPSGTYDLVYSFGVIHHTPYPERAVEQIAKFMGPASELRVMVYSKVSYKLFWIMKEKGIWDLSLMDALIAENSEAQSGCPVTYTYTMDEARRLLTGFEILEMRKAHIFTWDVDAYRNYEYRKDATWAHVSDERLKELEKELGWHLLIRAKLAGPAQDGGGA